MRPFISTLLAAALVSPLVAHAQAPVPTAAHSGEVAPDGGPIRDLDAVVVSGVVSGPGMWKVRKGDHTLWVLGTLSPLPKKIEWVSRDVDAVLGVAQEVIWQPSLVIGTDVGMFRLMTLAPKALGARKNPGGETLQDVVPAEMYARWLPLKQKYVGRGGGIEKWRPMFAAMELFDEAMDDVGLVEGGVVGPTIERAIKRRKIPVSSPSVKIAIEDPKQLLNEFRSTKLDDLECFGKTLDRLESDVDAMRERANAWAVGDVDALRALPYSDQNEACMQAAMRAGVMQKRVKRDIDAEVRDAWMQAAEKALAKNSVTFSTLPMRELLKPDGYLAQLQAKGYEVEAP
ncbi:TraB/GumN family protein [Cognatilysobacter bugurensis]|uniref:GumN protein n=1 Tax=Cognatilysobacter bugurensis TaxID=543356 RepID=A0A918SXH3_9GAMM|nr:TraB/GumN family protein [Lysobacter bugurensis]GHA76145.1 GumN protein [Lysobacter bugurensis]